MVIKEINSELGKDIKQITNDVCNKKKIEELKRLNK